MRVRLLLVFIISLIAAAIITGCTRESTIDAKTYYANGKRYLVQEKYQEAINEFNKALKIVPEGVETLYQIGQAYKGTGHYEQALFHFKKAYDADPTNNEALDQIIFLNTKKEIANYDEAIEYGVQALKTRPERVSLLNNVAAAYASKGDMASAKEYYLKSLEIRPEQADILSQIGRIYFREENYKKSLESFETSLKYDSTQKSVRLAIEDVKEKLSE
jgi:tetratricopeptide (TPR) repeat protein